MMTKGILYHLYAVLMDDETQVEFVGSYDDKTSCTAAKNQHPHSLHFEFHLLETPSMQVHVEMDNGWRTVRAEQAVVFWTNVFNAVGVTTPDGDNVNPFDPQKQT